VESQQRERQELLLVGLSLNVSGQSISFNRDGAEVLVGRAMQATFRIDHLSVSRKHAKFVRSSSPSGPIVTVVDLGSTQGTFVNDQRLTGPMKLVDGDTLRVGDVFLRFVVLRGPEDLGGFLGFSDAPTQQDLEVASEPPPTLAHGLPRLDDDEPDSDSEATSSRMLAPMLLPSRDFNWELECVKCGARSPGKCGTLCKCGGMLDAAYDLSTAKFIDSENSFVRFADLLPVRDRRLFPTTARRTPCVHAARLGQAIGLRSLYLKNETRLPTGTTKDRASVVVLAMFLEQGTLAFATSSTGNAGSGYAYALQTEPSFGDMEMHLFVGENFSGRSHYGDSRRVKVFALKNGTFEDASAVAAAYAKQKGMPTDGGFFSPGKREGAKLAFFESVEQIPRPIDWYVQAISSGLGVQGIFKGAKELAAMRRIDRLPRLLCVQEDTCAPQVRAWREGAVDIRPEHIVREPKGIALAVHRGDPSRAYPYMRESVIESKGTFTAVGETEIRETREMIRELEGIEVCFNSACAMAGVIREARAGVIRGDQVVLVNLTGRDRTPETATRHITWLEYVDGSWKTADGSVTIPDDQAFKRRHDVHRSQRPPAR
jgi:threonine synthase